MGGGPTTSSIVKRSTKARRFSSDLNRALGAVAVDLMSAAGARCFYLATSSILFDYKEDKK